jgi:hypothetical protein
MSTMGDPPRVSPVSVVVRSNSWLGDRRIRGSQFWDDDPASDICHKIVFAKNELLRQLLLSNVGGGRRPAIFA